MRSIPSWFGLLRHALAGTVTEDLDDVRRVDATRYLDLTLEAGDVVGVFGEVRVDELERDDRASLSVARFPDGSHAAGADLLQEFETLSHITPPFEPNGVSVPEGGDSARVL